MALRILITTYLTVLFLLDIALLSTVENVVRDKNFNFNSVDLLLYGDPSFTAEIICATLDYIDKTNRLTYRNCLYPFSHNLLLFLTFQFLFVVCHVVIIFSILLL